MGEGIEAWQSCFAALGDLALAICAGALLLRVFMAAIMLSRVLQLGLAALAAGLAGGLWAESASMSGAQGMAVWQAVPVVLEQTAFGHAMLLAMLAWSLLLGVFLLQRRLGAWARLAWCALALLCIAHAAAGHAIDGGWDSYAIWVHALHIGACCTWAGTVFLSAGLALDWRNWAVPQRLEFAHKISHAATLALVAVAASGVVNTLRMLGEAGVSFNDHYTRLLAAKLFCVALAMGMGGYNRWRIMPRLMEKGAARRFAAVLLAEGAVLLVVTLLAAQLGVTMPPM